MIFDQHEAIYFHIGKTAGYSIEKLLNPEDHDARIADRTKMFGWDKTLSVYLQHATANIVQQLAGEDKFERYLKFSVVRNPYARAISVYHYAFDSHQRNFGSFENYIMKLPTIMKQLRSSNGSHHIPQVRYTKIDGKNICDMIAHFEALPHSLTPILDKLNITQPLKKLNTHRGSDWGEYPVSSYYTESMERIIQDVYAEDFISFGYSDKAIDADVAG